MATFPQLSTYHYAGPIKIPLTNKTFFDSTANTRVLDIRFMDYDSTISGSSGNTNYFTIIPGVITYSFPLYFGVYHSDFANTLSNPSYKISSNTFGTNSKITITASAQTSYAQWTNPSNTGDSLFSTTSLPVQFITSGGTYNFGGTTASSYSGGNIYSQAIRMQLKVDNTSNNADVLASTNYTITYTWTET